VTTKLPGGIIAGILLGLDRRAGEILERLEALRDLPKQQEQREETENGQRRS
jgi:hypothetical protein